MFEMSWKRRKTKKRPDLIEKQKIRQNEKKYSTKYRENKRTENNEAYLHILTFQMPILIVDRKFKFTFSFG